MKTRLTELLGIKYPIIQGGMAWGSSGRLAAAVSEAGGLGILGYNVGPEWMREEIRRARTLTDKPFGINIPLLNKGALDYLEIAEQEKVAVIAFGAGKPPAETVRHFQKLGTTILSVVPHLRAALGCQEMGVDAIVVEGTEAGGRIGELSTMVLMTEVIPQIKVPVAAAGGISDGRGLAAAMVMGAAGIQMGTRFLCAEECEIHENAKKQILNAVTTDITVTGSVRKKTSASRGVRNAFSQKFHEMEDAGASAQELSDLAAGTNRKGLEFGDVDQGFVQAGQVSGTINEILPAREIIEGICSEAEAILRNAPSLFG